MTLGGIRSAPFGYVCILQNTEKEKLLSYLQQVEAGEIVPDDVEYVGVIEKMFVLHMVDGTNISISASNPLFIVDGTRYKSTI